MTEPTFSERLSLKQVGKDEFENIYEPWEWPWAKVIPGGLLMSLAAAAAYKTIDSSQFTLDNLECKFLRGIASQVPMRFKVTRLSNGKRFVVRSVIIEQKGDIMWSGSMTFVNKDPWTGASNRYAVGRKTEHTLNGEEGITLDDLAFPGVKKLRPMMKFQRFALTFTGMLMLAALHLKVTQADTVHAKMETTSNQASQHQPAKLTPSPPPQDL
jgi:acyl-CoA thioesterase